MILGTSIGAGMLALPVVAAHENFLLSFFLLFVSWLVMTLGAFSLLEVNLWQKSGANLISMAQTTLGKWGAGCTWLIYLLLLYSLICAYLAGSSDIAQALLASLHWMLQPWQATLLTLFCLGLIVYQGIGFVDRVNRGLMSIKLIAYVVIVVAIAPHIHLHWVLSGDYQIHNNVWMVMVTSFGFATILPSLRGYLNEDKTALKMVVLLGSLLPLLVYSIWILIVQGLIPRMTEHGLVAIANSDRTNADLIQAISVWAHSSWVAHAAKLFISICALTSFLGVSIGLVDFVADGLKLQKRGRSGVWVYLLSYGPPLSIVLAAPGIFIKALAYAGVLCILLLIFLPLLMLYRGRYSKRDATIDHTDIQKIIPLNKTGLSIAIIAAGLFVLYEIIQAI